MSSSTAQTQHHHHRPSHEHGQHHDSVAQANKEYFDNPANDYRNDPAVKERAARVVKAILRSCTTDKEKTTVMDFACGNGTVSKELAPYVKSILGVDVSQRGIEQYNENFKDDEKASGVCIELKGEEGELSNARFDMIFCASAYHHFASIEGITRILASFLNPGGVLIVADMVYREEGYKFQPKHEHAVPHKHGVSKQDMQRAFGSASLIMRAFEDIPPATEHPDQDLFLAIGEKLAV